MSDKLKYTLRMVIWKTNGLPTGHQLDDIDEEIVDQAHDQIMELREEPLKKIKDIIAQPPDRISSITIESYEKIRQAIFEAISEAEKNMEAL